MSPRSSRADRRRRYGRALLVAGVVVITAFGGLVAAIDVWPDLGAEHVDRLRDLLSDRVVAQLETTIFQAQDSIRGWVYRLGGKAPAAPWVVALETDAKPDTRLTTVAIGPTVPIPVAPAYTYERDRRVRATSSPSATPTPSPAWHPAPLPALGSLPGVGQWSQYLHTASGRTIAYRAFLQPDPERPYAVAAIVAFDLQAIRLHFILGTDEPASSVAIRRTGTISAQDRQPGVLLAAFNGGFKARHGHFGVMVDGITVLPPRDGFGTVAMYRDGHVRVGAWGSNIRPSHDLLAWRQNGPLVIEHGQVNPHTTDTRSQDWGIILNGITAVWRSGLGVSSDGRTLYYVAGTSMTLPALVQALVATGAANAIQLDINTTMVHFDTFTPTPAGLASQPLLAVMKPQQDDRYLTAYSRDYFYVTSVEH